MRLIKILLLLQLIISLNSCGPLAYKKVDARKVSWDPEERVKKNLEEGRGFRLFEDEKKFGTTYEFASSNELWRATLDTIDFMPLTTANYSGGIVVTDWYSDNQSLSENIKITVRFLTNEIRSDALNVKVYTKKCENLNKCNINENNPEIQNKLITTILSKASRYKQEKDKKSRKIN